MRKCKDRVLALSLAVFVFVTMAVSFGTITASAADGYTLHFFDTLEDGASCLGTYADYGKDSVYGPAPYDTEYGYGNGIKIVADGNKSGYEVVFNSAIAIEEGKYVEIEYDYTQSAGTGSTGQYKLDLNTTQFAYYQGNGSMYLTTSTGVHTMVSASIPVAYHRYKFTLRAVRNETNELSWEVCSLLIDGEEILKGDYSGPYSAGAYKGDIGKLVFRRGSSNKNAIAYWDNISVISYFPVDGTSPAPDRYGLLNAIKTAYSELSAAYESASIDEADYNSIMGTIDNAHTVMQNKDASNATVNATINELSSLPSMIQAYKKMKETGTTSYIDVPNAFLDVDSLDVDSATVSVPVYTTSGEPTVNLIGLLYQSNEDLHSGVLLDVVPATKDIAANSADKVTLTFDLSGYSDRDKLYAKVVSVDSFDQILTKATPSKSLLEPAAKEYSSSLSFIEDVNVGLASLNANPETEVFKVGFALKGTAGKEVSVLVMDSETETEGFADSLKSSIVHYDTTAFDANGKAAFEFVPDEVGTYKYIVNVEGKSAVTGEFVYANKGDIDDILDILYDTKTMSSLTDEQLSIISMSKSSIDDAQSAGVDVDSILAETLEEDTYTAEKVGAFSASVLAKISTVRSVREAASSDAILSLLSQSNNSLKLSKLNALRPKKQQDACEYIFDYKTTATDIASTNSLISKAVNSVSGGGGSGGGGGGGSSSGGSIIDDSNSTSGVIITGGFTETTESAKQPQNEGPTIYQESVNMFNDLDSVEWAKNEIMEFAARGWVSGRAEGVFAPNDKITREEFIKMAVNVFGFYNEDATCDFADTKSGDWHYSYIASAVSNGIVTGLPDGTFGTGANITREDMAVIIYRIAKMKNLKLTVDGEYLGFVDEDYISDYAKEAIVELSKSGVVNGMEDDTFLPKGLATRAEAIKMLYGANSLK